MSNFKSSLKYINIGNISIIFDPKNLVVDHLSGLQPLNDNNLIEVAVRNALITKHVMGAVYVYLLRKADSPRLWFLRRRPTRLPVRPSARIFGDFEDYYDVYAYVVHVCKNAIYANYVEILQNIDRISIELYPILANYKEFYREIHTSKGDVEEEYNIEPIEDADAKDEEYATLIKFADVVVDNIEMPIETIVYREDEKEKTKHPPKEFRLYIAILYQIESKRYSEMNISIDTKALGYVPLLIASQEYCHIEGQVIAKCEHPDLMERSLWHRRFIREYSYAELAADLRCLRGDDTREEFGFYYGVMKYDDRWRVMDYEFFEEFAGDGNGESLITMSYFALPVTVL